MQRISHLAAKEDVTMHSLETLGSVVLAPPTELPASAESARQPGLGSELEAFDLVSICSGFGL